MDIDKEEQKRIPVNRSINMNNIIKNGGYYDINCNWNSIMRLSEYPHKIFRGRVEVLILKDDSVFLCFTGSKPGEYRIPGGSFDKNILNIHQVYNEAKEETKMIIKNIEYSGDHYVKLFTRKKCRVNRVSWDGTYNEIYTAEFDKPFYGTIKTSVFDYNMFKYGNFYKIDDIKHLLKPQHKKILLNKISTV